MENIFLIISILFLASFFVLLLIIALCNILLPAAKAYAFLFDKNMWKGYVEVKNAKKAIFTNLDDIIEIEMNNKVEKGAVYHYLSGFWIDGEPVLLDSKVCTPLYKEQYKRLHKDE